MPSRTRIDVCLWPSIKNRIKQLAKERNQSLSEFVCCCIEKELDDVETRNDSERLQDNSGEEARRLRG